jgi:hypothetical protein
MTAAQLNSEPAMALVRLRAHAHATHRTPTGVARDILARRLLSRPRRAVPDGPVGVSRSTNVYQQPLNLGDMSRPQGTPGDGEYLVEIMRGGTQDRAAQMSTLGIPVDIASSIVAAQGREMGQAIPAAIPLDTVTAFAGVGIPVVERESTLLST